MPKSRPITLQIECEEKKSSTDQLQISEWEKSDGILRSGVGAGAVILTCLIMIPIPMVHFAVIPVFLFGLPFVTFFTFRMYSKGMDLRGIITCPECSLERNLTRSVSYWPVSMQCLGCKKFLTLSPLE